MIRQKIKIYNGKNIILFLILLEYIGNPLQHTFIQNNLLSYIGVFFFIAFHQSRWSFVMFTYFKHMNFLYILFYFTKKANLVIHKDRLYTTIKIITFSTGLYYTGISFYSYVIDKTSEKLCQGKF